MKSASIKVLKSSIKGFEIACANKQQSVITTSRKAVKQVCEDILRLSLVEVPKATLTLRDSGYVKVTKSTDEAGEVQYTGIVGYGAKNAHSNPKSGRSPNDYMVYVHEDLTKRHPNGKAKFLEDPFRAYINQNLTNKLVDMFSAGLNIDGEKQSLNEVDVEAI
jgi:hypothetical protein